MTALDREIHDKVLVYRLAAERQDVDPELLARTGRTARTLVKQGALRVTLLVLAPGGDLASHHADGPVTIHVIDGAIALKVPDAVRQLEAGDLAALPPGVTHAVNSTNGATFVLTVLQTER